jgi:hypothetical protein
MMETFSLDAAPEVYEEKISRILKAGISQFGVGLPVGSNIRKFINLISEQVIPQFK